MKRIAIIGLPGSGKSTFAVRLGKALDLPVHHLDKHMFLSGGKKRDKQEFITLQKKLVDQEDWIIDGCSTSTFEMRFARAQVVLYFRPHRLLCLYRAFKRRFFPDRTLCDKSVFTWELVKYTWNFDKDKKALIETLRHKYPQLEFHIFTGSRDVDRFMSKSLNFFSGAQPD